MKELIGHKILGIETNEDKTYIYFQINQIEYMTYHADGEFCASVWFETVPSNEDIAGAIVLDVLEKEWHPSGEEGDEVEDVMFYTLVTDKGYLDIGTRFRHNGYYGGSVDYEGLYVKGFWSPENANKEYQEKYKLEITLRELKMQLFYSTQEIRKLRAQLGIKPE